MFVKLKSHEKTRTQTITKYYNCSLYTWGPKLLFCTSFGLWVYYLGLCDIHLMVFGHYTTLHDNKRWEMCATHPKKGERRAKS